MAASSRRELPYKWLLYLFLAAFAPLPYYAPVVGAFPLSWFLILIYSLPLLGPHPFLLLMLAQIIVYGVLLYVAAKYLARYFIASSNRVMKAGLLVVLDMNLVFALFNPQLGAGEISILARYLELFG